MTYTYKVIHISTFAMSIYVMESLLEFDDFVPQYCTDNMLQIDALNHPNLMAIAHDSNVDGNKAERVIIMQV